MALRSSHSADATLPWAHSGSVTVRAVRRLVAGPESSPAATATDDWKLELLDTLCLDHYFTVGQACAVLRAFDSSEPKEAAAARLFGRVTNPEDWHVVLANFPPRQHERIQERIGAVDVFNPKNPSGRYVLQLSNQVCLRTVNSRLRSQRCTRSWPFRSSGRALV